MNVGVISFPGSTGDHDALSSLETDVGVEVRLVDYRETSLTGLDAIVLPGGSSYGDALRPGAIARWTPIMTAVAEAAAIGVQVLGIGNGFQILCEARLLPGVLLQNRGLHFISTRVQVKIENIATPWTNKLSHNQVLSLPIAHGFGAYYIDVNSLDLIKAKGQIVARYCDAEGNSIATASGSTDGIAGICNEAGNVVGMMPHPDRATNKLIGGTDGLSIFNSLLHVNEASV